MQIHRDTVLDFLQACQAKKGGYSGEDIAKLAKRLGVSRRGLKKRVDSWHSTHPEFTKINYLGKRSISLTLDDFSYISHQFKSNPIIVKQNVLDDVNKLRQECGLSAIPKSTFYRITEQYRPIDPHYWFKAQEIIISGHYDFLKAKHSLSDTFTFSGLKTFGGMDLENIICRLREAERCFHEIYGSADPFQLYLSIRDRTKVIRNLLSSIKTDKSLSIQVRLVFEAQVSFLVECKDLVIEELIHKRGRIQQSMNASRYKVENNLRKKWIKDCSGIGRNVVINPNGDNLSKLKELLDEKMIDADEARALLIKRYKRSFESIYDYLDKLTKHFSESEIIAHSPVAQLLLDICQEKLFWPFLTDDERKKLIRNKDIIRELRLPNPSIAKAVLANKLIEYIQSGKLTIQKSFKFRDIGEVIKNITLAEEDKRITQEDLKMLINGSYPIELLPELTQIYPTIVDGEENDMNYSDKRIPLQQVLDKVSTLARDYNPTWFENHRQVFKRMTDGMFSIEYDVEKFCERLYQAIGFLGRNLRYNDAPSFHGLQYFIQRYVSDATLDLEFRHLWNVYEALTGLKTSLILIDSMGIDSRRKSLYAKIHGRYHTIGFADIRAISPYLIPVFSSNFRSTDSEAMNIVDIVNHAYSLLGEDLRFCAGNAHTVSRVAAGLAFVDHKVILIGRNPYPPEKPGKICIQRLINNIDLLNKIGKLIRDDSTYGRLIASRKHIYVNGVNIRNLLRDSGELILWNVKEKIFQIDNIIQLVETSNRQKRLVRIVERGVTRVHEPNVSLMLKASELILLMVGIKNIRQRLRYSFTEWKTSPISMENIALYVPA